MALWLYGGVRRCLVAHSRLRTASECHNRGMWLKVHVQPCSRSFGYCVTMDAVTLVAAAVAVAIDNSQQAALNDLLLERERAAMHAAYLESHAAQRAYVGDQQLPRPQHAPPQFYTTTWRDAYMLLETASNQSLNRMARVGVANARGDVNLVAQLVREELGDPPPPAEPESDQPRRQRRRTA